MRSLENLRKEMNELDAQLVKLWEQRMQTAREIAAYKQEHGLPVLDATREAEVLRRVAGHCEEKQMESYAIRLYQTILELSREYQKTGRE